MRILMQRERERERESLSGVVRGLMDLLEVRIGLSE
jgi:hypothetical protein